MKQIKVDTLKLHFNSKKLPTSIGLECWATYFLAVMYIGIANLAELGQWAYI